MYKSKEQWLKDETKTILLSGEDNCDSSVNVIGGIFHSTTGSINEFKGTKTPNGQALSPQGASLCFKDKIRTIKFLQGINDSIIEAKKRFPNQKIKILYAGCGPYATLITPILTQFSPNDFEVTLMDIHNTSLEYANNLILDLGLSDFICNSVNCDAVEYKTNDKYHIIISEVMGKALSNEPQVAVMNNLVKYLHKNGIFIPEIINIFYEIGDTINKKIGTVLKLQLGSKILNKKISNKSQKPIKLLELDLQGTNSDILVLHTNITTFGKKLIKTSESLITDKIEISIPRKSIGKSILFSYAFGTSPGIWTEFR